MGIIFSRFRNKVSTKETLQKIQEDIVTLEEYKEYTQQRGRKLVGSLVIYSFILCILTAIIFYFYYLPPTVNEKILYLTPFFGFILLINLVKRILTWYFDWKVRRNDKKLTYLKEEKKRILEDVMETETYKVAKDILETFAPETLKKTTQNLRTPAPMSTPINQNKIRPQVDSEVRRRITATPQQPRFARPMAPLSRTPITSTPMVRPGLGPAGMLRATSPTMGSQSYLSPLSPSRQNDSEGGPPPGPPMPRPVLPRERGILDRFVEFLVGDGPSNRYALVCRQCESHNGMALKEEFPYIAFRCAYCHYWNPARKQKPAPPRLETVPVESLAKKLKEESSSEDELEEDKTSSEDLKKNMDLPKPDDSSSSPPTTTSTTESSSSPISPEDDSSIPTTSNEESVSSEDTKGTASSQTTDTTTSSSSN